MGNQDKRERRKGNGSGILRSVSISSIVFALVTSMSYFSASVIYKSESFQITISRSMIYSSARNSIFAFILIFACTRFIYWCFDTILFQNASFMPEMNRTPNTDWRVYWLNTRNRTTLTASMKKHFLPYLLIILAVWSAWIAISWPGSLRDDTIAQLLQSSGAHKYYTQHPLFDTLIFSIFWNAGSVLGNTAFGLALYTLFQAIALAAGYAFLLCYLRRSGIPRLVSLLTLLYGTCNYLVFGAVTTMGKDTFHTIFLLPLAVLFVEACMTRGKVLQRKLVLASFVLLSTCSIASKRTALIVFLLSMIILLGISKSVRRYVVVALLGSILLAQFVWNPIAIAATGADESPSREIAGYFTQPIGRVQAKDPQSITAEERSLLEPVMDVVKAGEVYNPSRYDETMFTYRIDSSTHDKFQAMKAWVSIGLKNPTEYIKAYTAVFYNWFNPRATFTYPTGVSYVFTPVYMDQWYTYSHSKQTIDTVLAPLRAVPPPSGWRLKVTQAVTRIVQGSPFFSLGLYVTFIPLFIGIYLIRRKSWMSLAAWSFLAFNVLSCYASTALFWYSIPLFFILPLFCSLPFMKPRYEQISSLLRANRIQ